ncbi:MAG: metalloregulator ArsR/SmtB family transcription factor [Candidatus Schekmanbacteria bacterium]|nr:metalloregulator ArsR/SmtB family transcription factor [Candidatus Schekmanbacteria bacterium]
MRDVALFFKALADEARLQILWLLFNYPELCVCDLTKALGITQSKASRHLAALRHAGLVTDRRDGAWCFYSLHPARTELERIQLGALRVSLGGHPGAARVLRALGSWLEHHDHAAACAPDESRGAALPSAHLVAAGAPPAGACS